MPRAASQDPRRIYYRLTALGPETTLRAETERLSRVALVARRQLGESVKRHDACPCGRRIPGQYRLYARLLELYPPAFLERHRAEMLQNFDGPRRRGGVEGEHCGC